MHQSVRRLAGALLVSAMLGGCAQPPRLPPESAALPARVELREVPFFPQEAYQCGPAALATMLGQRGLALTPGQLKDEVFIPGREGSLQLEMVAAARRHGMLVYPLQGGLEGVLEEVAAGNPVLVLQNQAFSWWPRWHFAVVVGFDRERRELVLRSGITRRWVTDFTSFESTWKRSGRWAVLTLPGDRLPATAAAVPWLKAASDSEETGHPKVARRAYEEAVRRWPEDAFAWFALGNSRYAAGDSAAAEQAMLTSVERRVDFAAGWFNLSQLLNAEPADGRSATALTANERREIDDKQPPRAAVLHEVIRVQGEHELQRTLAALWWSAVAAGLTIGLSLMGMGLFRAALPEQEWAIIVSSFGYPMGFLAVILARQQLFTENTLTAVLPVMTEPTLEKAWQLLRLWSVVLFGNIVGTLLFAWAVLHLPIFNEAADAAFLEIGREVMHNDLAQMFAKGIVSGWMIATMVWLIPAAEGAKIWIIAMVTYLMALGSFTHIVVGSAEVGYLAFAGEIGWTEFLLKFALPTLGGNIVGGSLIFALISHAQIRSEG